MPFLDTDVLIDCLRGTLAAKAWLEQIATESFEVPGVVAMELVMGCRSRADLILVRKFLGVFTIRWPSASEFAHAYDLLLVHRLTSGLSIPDCLIAAMALTGAHPGLPSVHLQLEAFPGRAGPGCSSTLSTALNGCTTTAKALALHIGGMTETAG